MSKQTDAEASKGKIIKPCSKEKSCKIHLDASRWLIRQWQPYKLGEILLFVMELQFLSFAPLSSGFSYFSCRRRSPGWPFPSSFPSKSCKAGCALKGTGFAKQHSPQCSRLSLSLPYSATDFCSSHNSHKIPMSIASTSTGV